MPVKKVKLPAGIQCKITKDPTGNQSFHLTWPNYLIPRAAYKELIKLIAISTSYGPIDSPMRKRLIEGLREINSKYSTKLTPEHALSLHHIISKDKIMRDYPRLNRLAATLAAQYNAGTDILTLARKYTFPPLNLLRTILIANGTPERDLFPAFSGKSTASLSQRDLKQLKLANANDADSSINQAAIYKAAMSFEDIINHFFRSIGIRMRLQDELVEEQTQQFGRPIITPDILFLDPIYINGSRVAWLDCKNYMGNDIPFIYQSNVKQAAKYGAKWGAGAILYRYGASDDLRLPSAIVLGWE